MTGVRDNRQRGAAWRDGTADGEREAADGARVAEREERSKVPVEVTNANARSPDARAAARAIVSVRSAIPCGGAGHSGRGETGRLELRWPIRRDDAGVETRIWL